VSKLAVKGGLPVRSKSFFPWPHFDDRELRNLESVIRSRTWFAGMRGSDPGTKTEEFEKRFAEYHQSRFGVACANGTVAIEIALRAAGIGTGDEVIVPALTFIATLSAVLQVNAIPVVVDTDYETHCIDPKKIEAAVTERTRAIIPVHFGGFICDMERIGEISKKHNLVVIEDAAHAHGAVSGRRTAGSIGDIATFSFQESKTMTAGEGGIITTSDPDLAEQCIMYRSCGRKQEDSWYVHYVLPLNYRLSELQSAVLLAQLERLEEQLRTKNRNAAFLADRLGQIDGMTPVPGDGKTEVNGYYLYLLRYDKTQFSELSRDQFVAALNAEGIPSHIGYPWPLTKNPMFKGIPSGPKGCPYTCPFYGGTVEIANTHLPVAERICEETVVIPHEVLLSAEDDLEDIPKAIEKIQKNASDLLK